MAEELQDTISENTEITDNSGSFWAATGWGALAGTISMMALLILSEGGGIAFGAIIVASLFYGIFVGVFTLLGTALIGLPVTFVLRLIGCEFAWLYAALGAFAGWLMLFAIVFLPEGSGQELLAFTFCGGIAGLAAGLRWGRWREQRTRPEPETSPAPTSQRRDNPIHDLIH